MNIAELVEQHREAQREPRLRLGLSEVGHKCERFLWYRHKQYIPKPPNGRILRLFEVGDMLEERAKKDLMSIGYSVVHDQKKVVFEEDGIRLIGHIDGEILSDKTTLFECKSANEKSFKQAAKLGYEEWNPKYKAQIHVYMLGLDLTECLVWVENKNDSSIYTEIIKLDRDYALKTLERAFEAITKCNPPDRVCPRADWFEAKFCDYCEECWK